MTFQASAEHDGDTRAVSVPDLSDYLKKLDVEYASGPARPQRKAQYSYVEDYADRDLPTEVKTAMLIFLLIGASALGLFASTVSLFLGGDWLTAFAICISLPLLTTICWCLWMVR